jgi:hypothetical protein
MSVIDITGHSVVVAHTERSSVRAVLADRLEFIDIARGLFIVWMIAGHALTLAGVPLDHPLQWLRPIGWATVCFVLLTGITIPLVYDCRGGVRVRPGARRRLWRRAFEIGLIAFLSNFASRMITASLSGDLSLAYIWGVLTFQIPWSISAILIVTTCVLISAPTLLWLARRVRPLSLFLAVSILIVGFDLLLRGDGKWIAVPSGLRQWLKDGGLFGFPVVPLVLYSFWIFSQANLAKQVYWTKGLRGVIALFAVLVGGSLVIVMLDSRPLECIRWLTRFGMIIGIAIMIGKVRIFAAPKAVLGGLGRIGLFVFILHRPVLHIIFHALGGILSGPDLATVMMVLCLGAGLTVGIYRDRNAHFSLALRKWGF